MITEITPQIFNTYSCQYVECQKTFNSSKEEIIQPGFYPVCSSICGFRMIYNFIKNQLFEDQTLLEMQQIAEKKGKILNFKRNDALYSIAKFYSKRGLSNITFILGIRQPLSNDLTLSNDLPIDKTQSSIYIDDVSNGLSNGCQFDKHPSCQIILQKLGGLKKWF